MSMPTRQEESGAIAPRDRVPRRHEIGIRCAEAIRSNRCIRLPPLRLDVSAADLTDGVADHRRRRRRPDVSSHERSVVARQWRRGRCQGRHLWSASDTDDYSGKSLALGMVGQSIKLVGSVQSHQKSKPVGRIRSAGRAAVRLLSASRLGFDLGFRFGNVPLLGPRGPDPKGTGTPPLRRSSLGRLAALRRTRETGPGPISPGCQKVDVILANGRIESRGAAGNPTTELESSPQIHFSLAIGYSGGASPANERARSSTSSNMDSVSLPVKVFRWLGW